MSERFTDEYRKAQLDAALRKAEAERTQSGEAPDTQKECNDEPQNRESNSKLWPDESSTSSPQFEPVSTDELQISNSASDLSALSDYESAAQEDGVWPAVSEDPATANGAAKEHATKIIDARADEDLAPDEPMSEGHWDDLLRGRRTTAESGAHNSMESIQRVRELSPRRSSLWPLAVGLVLLCFMAAFMIVYAWLSKR